MTEQQWLTCDDAQAMLEFLCGRASARKLRLFACACCRQVWPLLIDERSRDAVEAAERLADGLLSQDEPDATFRAACAASLAVRGGPDDSPETMLRLRRRHDPDKLYRAAFIAGFAVGSGAGDIRAHIRGAEASLVDQQTKCRLLRCIFGNPLRPVTFDELWLRWNDGTIPTLTRLIYDECISQDVAILADALEDAGCADEAILSHLRGRGPHVRGCWVLDLILGKE